MAPDNDKTPTHVALTKGTMVSHYRIIKKIGAGGMGEVYLATDTNLDRQVAIKFLSADRSGDPEARQRFIQEARAQAMVSHANIAVLLDVGEADGRAFLVTELVDGQPLQELARSEKLTVDDVIDLVIQIAEGLQAAHERGVVHRDIKPENILITSKRQVKITDFGLARWKGATTLTKDGTRMGTAYYMSPEQAEGKRVDHRSDLFSLGVVLYELICHQRPFEGENESVVLYEILTAQPHPLARFCRDVPDELQRVVSKCLAKDPALRYQSAADLVADMRSAKRQGNTMAAVTATRPRKMLAVLPFANLGPADEEYFADGITEEITSRLAVVGELGVISRTSAMKYKGSGKSIREIGAELGADFILEGTVRWGRSPQGPSRVRITPQLIEVAGDAHIWSDQYDRIMDDVFAIQSDIAEQVIRQLNVTLSEPERRVVDQKPTENLEAYYAYLRGIDHVCDESEYRIENLESAQTMFERAVALDPHFAHAHAWLSRVHSAIYNYGHDRTRSRLDLARTAVDRALAEQPDLPEGHTALGFLYYRGESNWERALEEFRIAGRLQPNQSELLFHTGLIRRRQGRFTEAIDHMKSACALNPRHGILACELGTTYRLMRRFEEAETSLERSIAIRPNQIHAFERKAGLYWAWHADARKARATLEQIAGEVPVATFGTWYRHYLYERDFEGALAYVSSLPPDPFEDEICYWSKWQLLGEVHELMGNLAESRFFYEKTLSELAAAGKNDPDDLRLLSSLGLVHAGLGHHDDAVRETERAVARCPISKDALIGALVLEATSLVHTKVGDRETALDEIELLLSIPSWLSVTILRVDPRYDPLRKLPRFQMLLQQPDNVFR